MPLYENEKNAENIIKIEDALKNAVIFGTDNVIKNIVNIIGTEIQKRNRCITVAVDGWYAIEWEKIIEDLKKVTDALDVNLEFLPLYRLFKPSKELDEYKKPFLTDDPSFGYVNDTGKIRDLIPENALSDLKQKLKDIKKISADERKAIVIYGSGAIIPELYTEYDLTFYCDTTKQSVLWKMWGGNLVPFGSDKPKSDYWWKEYYYCDFYLLNEQKHFAFQNMHYYLEAIDARSLKLVPKNAFDAILSTLVQYPVKNVKYAQPGPWGAYRFKDTRWDMPELSNNAWNSLIAPNELAMLIDIGREEMLKMPGENLIHYPEQFVGSYVHKNFPRLIPLYIWLDDGYFPGPEPPERTSMPIHNHPSTTYVNRHFNEPLGRYETYYIAEAFEGANTWMGFHDDVDLEQWEADCRHSEKTGEPIKNWTEYIKNWDTNVGDLFLIPPGTSHGHGGNQMVIEMDTVPSVAGTEYSFFGYDFVRNTWDDEKKSMTADPMRMHIEHYFDNERWRRAGWVEEHLRPKPKIIKWTKDYYIDRYATLPEMPFEIERIHFIKRAEYDTRGRFMHMVVLSTGDRVRIVSKSDKDKSCEIEWFQGACIPACFGEYEVMNLNEGFSTLVLIRWKKG